jgi:hypothetical protein
LTGAFAWVETADVAGSGDVKKSSRLKNKSADAQCCKEKLNRKNLYQTGLAPVEQKASISDNKKEYWIKGINSFLPTQGLFFCLLFPSLSYQFITNSRPALYTVYV